MKKIKNWIILTLILLTVGISLLSAYKINKINDDLINWQNTAAKYQQTIDEKNNTYSRISQKFEEIKIKNEELTTLIDNKNEQIRNKTEIITILTDSIENIPTYLDTIYIENNKTFVRNFNIIKRQNGVTFTINGYFLVQNPFTISFKKIMVESPLNIVITENKEGIWKTYAYSNSDNIKYDIKKTEVVPYKQSFIDKFKFGIGGYASNNNAGILFQSIYQNYSIILGYGTDNIVIGGMYIF